jgi:hypothetical protein
MTERPVWDGLSGVPRSGFGAGSTANIGRIPPVGRLGVLAAVWRAVVFIGCAAPFP